MTPRTPTCDWRLVGRIECVIWSQPLIWTLLKESKLWIDDRTYNKPQQPPDPQFILTKTLLKCASRPTMTGGHSYLGCTLGKVLQTFGSIQKFAILGSDLKVSKCILDTVDRILREHLDPGERKHNGETHQNQGRCLQKKTPFKSHLAEISNLATSVL